MKDIHCNRTAYVTCTLQVPLEWHGRLEEWHDAFIKLMNEKKLPEHSASSLDAKSARIICDNCDKELTDYQSNIQDDDDQVLCDSCMNDRPEPDDMDGIDEDHNSDR